MDNDRVTIKADLLYDEFYGILNSDEGKQLVSQLCEFVASKNDYYGDSWQTDGLLTTITDIKDKLYRTQTIVSKMGKVTGQYVYFPVADDTGKKFDLEDIFKDLFIRCLMGYLKIRKMYLNEQM